MIKNTSTCRFECHQDTILLIPTGTLTYAFYTSRTDNNPLAFTARQYNQFKKNQKNVPTIICTYRGRAWWWYKLEFFTAPETLDEQTVLNEIHARVDAPETSHKPVDTETSHAQVLGLGGRVTFADIKKHYRQRMLEYHPDKVAGLGPKLRDLAEEESKKINAAFEFFEAKYGNQNNA